MKTILAFRSYVIFEPLLEQIELPEAELFCDHCCQPLLDFELDSQLHCFQCGRVPRVVNDFEWVIVGGESGGKPRPCFAEWIWDLVYQCEDRRLPILVKQLGSNARVKNANAMEWPGSTMFEESGDDGYASARVRLKNRKGGDPSEWPEDLRIRQFPKLAVFA